MLSVVLLASGLLAEHRTFTLLGGLGAAATFVGFILPRLILPSQAESEHESPESNQQS